MCIVGNSTICKNFILYVGRIGHRSNLLKSVVWGGATNNLEVDLSYGF